MSDRRAQMPSRSDGSEPRADALRSEHGHDARDGEATWVVEQEGFDPAREHAMESIYTVGNGYLGVRGAPDAPLPGSQGDMFVAGIYDQKRSERPYSELEFLNVDHDDYPYGELASLPFPFRVQLALDGQTIGLANDVWRTHRRRLDLRQGVLQAELVAETDRAKTVIVTTRRCASLADHHLLLQEINVRLVQGAGELAFDASLHDPNLGENHPHLIEEPLAGEDPQHELRAFSTRVSRLRVCIASRTRLVGSGRDARVWRVAAADGQNVTLRRYALVYSSRDVADPVAAARSALRALRWEDFEAQFAEHAARWAARWSRADLTIAGSPAAEQALRFNSYHLLSAAGHDPEVSVPARALSGRAYEGHIFWDVEIFMLPFYLHTCPELARSLLLYRYHTLDGARRRARSLGYRGACFAWESTATGDDVTPRKILLRTTGKEIPIFTGTEQVHVTADIAYGVVRYWSATHDHTFLRDAGVELLAESARFWVSRSSLEAGRYHIRGVVGPDEYHHSVDDNAYTNWLARFNLERASWAMAWLRQQDARAAAALSERLQLATHELEEWALVADRLFCPEPDARGVIEQFAGFFELDDYQLPKRERFKAPIDRLFEWEKINRLKLIKQADVLMLPLLFPERFSERLLAANYHYYEPLTDHGSSLSPAVHAALAARLGLREDAERYFRESLWLDLSNVMANSALGVHPACMGGSWQALVFGFLDVRFDESGPRLGPLAGRCLPDAWRSVALKLAFRGQSYPVELTP